MAHGRKAHPDESDKSSVFPCLDWTTDRLGNLVYVRTYVSSRTLSQSRTVITCSDDDCIDAIGSAKRSSEDRAASESKNDGRSTPPTSGGSLLFFPATHSTVRCGRMSHLDCRRFLLCSGMEGRANALHLG